MLIAPHARYLTAVYDVWHRGNAAFLALLAPNGPSPKATRVSIDKLIWELDALVLPPTYAQLHEDLRSTLVGVTQLLVLMQRTNDIQAMQDMVDAMTQALGHVGRRIQSIRENAAA